MKNFILLIITLFATVLCTGQQINKAEYYIDSDPGFGSGTPIALANPGNDLELSFNINTNSLSEGFHCLLLRARDNIGRWSGTLYQNFYVFKFQNTTSDKIEKAEYFIDSDPGFGLATPVSISAPDTKLTLSFSVSLSMLSEGFHTIQIRAMDESGRWGHAFRQTFYTFKYQNIVESEIDKMEYFIDSDPGFGNGTSINIASPGKNIEVDFNINLSGINAGDHILYLRAKDALGRWGHTYASAFSLTITGIEKTAISEWFKLYPNPGNGAFTIEFADNQNYPVTIKISDLSGKILYHDKATEKRNLLSIDLNTGIYIINVESLERRFVQKLFVNQ